jgi:hypothetical protein
MYYIDNCKIYRYFASYNNILFKTSEEYYQYLKDNGIETQKTSLFRRSKYALENETYKLGAWVSYDIAPGTVVFDSRDYSMYTFESNAEAGEFLKYHRVYPDRFCQQCFYDGYGEEDEKNSLEYIANQYVANFEASEFDPLTENTVYAHFAISYLPDEEELRKVRKEAFEKCILDMKEITPTTRIYINAQNYKEEDYLDDPQITYLFKHEKGIGAQAARNELFKWFYDSNYEWMIISDDDSFLAPTESTKLFFKELAEDPDKFKSVPLDICYSRNMQFEPWMLKDIDRAEYRSENWDFEYRGSSWLCWTLIRNFKKAYGNEEYQDETIDPTKTMGYDDTDFSFTLASKGYKSWRLPTLQLLPFNAGENHSSIFNNVINPMYRIRNMSITRSKFLSRTKEGFLDWEGFRLKNNQPWSASVKRLNTNDVLTEVTGRNIDFAKQEYLKEREESKYYD